MLYAKHRGFLSRLFGVTLFVLILFTGRSLEAFSVLADSCFFVGTILVGLASIGRIWCSLYISGYKDGRLIQEGPYSVSRNPLYFLNMIGGVGIGFATETLLIPALIIVGFAVYYPNMIREEEKKLLCKFGKQYEAYCLVTPKFFPKFSLFHAPETYIINTRLFSRDLLRSLYFIFFLGFLELVEAFQENGFLWLATKIL